jgi:hypothetical protein
MFSSSRKSRFIEERQQLPKDRLLSSLQLGFSRLATLELKHLFASALGFFLNGPLIFGFGPQSNNRQACYCLLVLL